MGGHWRLLLAALLLWHAGAQLVNPSPGMSRSANRRARKASAIGASGRLQQPPGVQAGCSTPAPRYTLNDLLVVMPSSHDRLSLVDASRDWREGMKTFVLLDRPIDGINISTAFLDKKERFQETYGYFGDMHDSRRWSQAGDARAALAPFRANKTVGLSNYKWILYGDDDTVFFPQNVLDLVNGLDHEMPYYLTDHLWFPEWKGHKDKYVHASRRAPRCLPCNYTDPLEASGVGHRINSFKAIKACPCTMDALCKGADNPGIINSWDCTYTKYRPGWWMFGHGGAGAILSAGLFRLASYAEAENRVWNQRGYTSGDSLFTEIVWEKMRIMPTDPGKGYFRPYLRMFDPGWKGPQAKHGAQDTDTEDWGNDPGGVIARMESADKGECRGECEESMDNIITTHIRSRFAEGDVDMQKVEALAQSHAALKATPQHLRAAAYIHIRLAELGRMYASIKSSRLPSSQHTAPDSTSS